MYDGGCTHTLVGADAGAAVGAFGGFDTVGPAALPLVWSDRVVYLEMQDDDSRRFHRKKGS